MCRRGAGGDCAEERKLSSLCIFNRRYSGCESVSDKNRGNGKTQRDDVKVSAVRARRHVDRSDVISFRVYQTWKAVSISARTAQSLFMPLHHRPCRCTWEPVFVFSVLMRTPSTTTSKWTRGSPPESIVLHVRVHYGLCVDTRESIVLSYYLHRHTCVPAYLVCVGHACKSINISNMIETSEWILGSMEACNKNVMG